MNSPATHHPDDLPDDLVDSPCINICKLDDTGTLCTGCLRTRTEIGAWSVATNAEKRVIMENTKRRARLLAARG